MSLSLPDENRLRVVRAAIIEWFTKHGRTYPWRERANAYEILIAEMLLRRTTATAVSRVYPEFIKRYPAVERLAKSRRDSVERLLSTLGLQSIRARNLKQMASMILHTHAGSVPADYEALIALPGVGEYTANAVLNFAFEQSRPLVDGNVIHLINRVFSCIFESPTKRAVWNFMMQFGGVSQDARLYWGIIDLVATTCHRKHPRCDSCPVKTHCDFMKSRTE